MPISRRHGYPNTIDNLVGSLGRRCHVSDDSLCVDMSQRQEVVTAGIDLVLAVTTSRSKSPRKLGQRVVNHGREPPSDANVAANIAEKCLEETNPPAMESRPAVQLVSQSQV